MITGDRAADVVVVGAGVAGIPAAIAAARAGAKVLLLEEDLQPGGAPVDNFITMPCGRPRAGIYGEMLARLDADWRFPLPDHGPCLRLWDYWYLPSAYAAVIAEMLAAEANLELQCGVRVREALVQEGPESRRVTGLVVPTADGGEAQIRAQVTIDATGTGAIAAQAGADVMYGEEARGDFGEPHAPEIASERVQPCTWLYLYQRLGGGEYVDVGGKLRGVDPTFGWVGVDPQKARTHNSGIYLMWGRTLPCADTRSEQALADTQVQALEGLREDLLALHRHGYLTHLAPKMGVRESRRIRGDAVVREQDLRSGRLPEDVIALGHWFLDLWGQQLSEQEREVPPFGIPYGAVLPRGMEGLLVVGKAISITHLALSAYRVQPPVAALGQAAGVAAALSARREVPLRAVEAAEIRRVVTGPGQGATLTPEDCRDPRVE